MRYATEITKTPRGTICCGNDPKAVYFNPYNEVVQCHSCGHVYEPKPSIAEAEADELDPTVNTRRAAVTAPRGGVLLSDNDATLLAHAITIAREVQEFIWADCYPPLRPYDAERWRRLFQKRVDCIAEIDLTKHGGLAALRKRLLQQAALSIKALALVNRWAKTDPVHLSTGSDGSDLRDAVTASPTPAESESPSPDATIELLEKWLQDPEVEHDEGLERLLRAINENSLSDRAPAERTRVEGEQGEITMTELQIAIDTAIKEDWELIKDIAGVSADRASMFDLAYRFGWHAAQKYVRSHAAAPADNDAE